MIDITNLIDTTNYDLRQQLSTSQKYYEKTLTFIE